ncbi:Uncharacterized protein DAT39_008571, partial [Clarias magur]
MSSRRGEADAFKKHVVPVKKRLEELKCSLSPLSESLPHSAEERASNGPTQRPDLSER